jgi:hypothetical protein
MKNGTVSVGKLRPGVLPKPSVPAKQSKWIPGESLLGLVARGDIEFLEGRGLRIRKDLPREVWREGFMGFMGWEKGLQFYLGDMLIHAEHNYGEKYVWAMQECMRAESTLKGMVWVCSHIPPERRVALSYGHHKLVARLPEAEQTEWLQKALAGDWSVQDLTEAIRTSSKSRNEDDEEVSRGRPFMWEDSVFEFIRVVNRKIAPVAQNLDPESRHKLKGHLTDLRNRLDQVCRTL